MPDKKMPSTHCLRYRLVQPQRKDKIETGQKRISAGFLCIHCKGLKKKSLNDGYVTIQNKMFTTREGEKKNHTAKKEEMNEKKSLLYKERGEFESTFFFFLSVRIETPR